VDNFFGGYRRQRYGDLVSEGLVTRQQYDSVKPSEGTQDTGARRQAEVERARGPRYCSIRAPIEAPRGSCDGPGRKRREAQRRNCYRSTRSRPDVTAASGARPDPDPAASGAGPAWRTAQDADTGKIWPRHLTFHRQRVDRTTGTICWRRRPSPTGHCAHGRASTLKRGADARTGPTPSSRRPERSEREQGSSATGSRRNTVESRTVTHGAADRGGDVIRTAVCRARRGVTDGQSGAAGSKSRSCRLEDGGRVAKPS